jgi:L-fuculose-phosphate aldolase
MMRDSPNLRRLLIQYARRLTETGLTRNTSGNLSHRVEDGMIVTPTGLDYATLEADDIVLVDHEGCAHGRRLPSSEWRFHRDILGARPEIDVVLHAHAPFATSIACLRRGIPAFHYMIAVAGGHDIRCGAYATYGTPELSRHAVLALDGRKACLLANHGLIALGTDFEAALELAIEVETLAEMYWRACQIGAPVILDDAEMVRVLEKFRDYGKQPPLPTEQR